MILNLDFDHMQIYVFDEKWGVDSKKKLVSHETP